MANIPFLNNAYFAAKVGIRTESPTGVLHIKTTDDSNFWLAKIEADGTTQNALLAITDTTSGTGVRFDLGGQTGSFTVLNSGNVGIGMTIPGAKLHVNSGLINTVALFESTDDKAFIRIKDDNTDVYLISKDSKFYIGSDSSSYQKFNVDISSGNVGIGSATPGAKLVVTDDNNGQDTTFRVNHTRSDSNVATQAIEVDMNLSGSDTTTADRTNSGIKIDLDSSADGDGLNEQRIYGVFSDVAFTGFSDLARGGFFKVESNNNTEKTSQMVGVYGQATHDSNNAAGGVSNMYGVYGIADIQDLGDVDNAFGGYFQVELGNLRGAADFGVTKGVEGHININKAATVSYNSMTAVSAVIDNNEGTAPNFNNQFLFKGDYQGDRGSDAYGIYCEGDRHYLEGKLAINLSTPTQVLHVAGNARVTGAYYDSNNSPGTANQVLVSTVTGTDWVDGSGSSIIGGPYLPLAGGTMTGRITTTSTEAMRINANDAFISGYTSNGLTRNGYIQFQSNGVVIDAETGQRRIILGLNNLNKVGIGTTTPGGKLDIYYSGTGGTGTQGIGEGLNITSLTPNITFNDLSSSVDNYAIHLNQNVLTLGRYTSATSQSPDLVLVSGNVGIGTTSPDNISSTGTVLSISTQGALTTNSLAGSLTFLTNDASFTNTYADGVTTQISSICESTTGAAYGLSFSTSTITSSNRAERLRITATGNVGIGTTNPSRKFVVSNGGASGIEIEPNYVTGVNEILSFNRSSSVYEAMRLNGGSFEFQINGSEKMRILANGNVGIGTTSPTEKLDISGTAIVRSTLFTVGNVHGFNPSFGASFFINNSGGTSYFNTTGGNVGIGTTSPTAKLHVAGTGLFTGLVSGITPVSAANFVTKAYVDGGSGGTGPFLPLAGGTMTGTAGVLMPDNFRLKFGDATTPDLQIFHNATDSFIINEVGDFYISNQADNKDIVFTNDNGSGGTATYFRLDSSLVNGTTTLGAVSFPDKSKLLFGAGNDLQIYHDGSHSYINDPGVGALKILASQLEINNAANSENIATFTQDGAVSLYYNGSKKFETTNTGVTVTGEAKANYFKAISSIPSETSANTAYLDFASGNTRIVSKGPDGTTLGGFQILQQASDSSPAATSFSIDTSSNATFTGTVTAGSYFLGDDTSISLATTGAGTVFLRPNGQSSTAQSSFTTTLATIGTSIAITGAATATTATTSTDNNATLTTKGYVDGLVTGVPVYKGTWDASGTAGGTPDLRLAANKVLGNYYIVSTAGSATPNGAGTEPNSWNCR